MVSHRFNDQLLAMRILFEAWVGINIIGKILYNVEGWRSVTTSNKTILLLYRWEVIWSKQRVVLDGPAAVSARNRAMRSGLRKPVLPTEHWYHLCIETATERMKIRSNRRAYQRRATVWLLRRSVQETHDCFERRRKNFPNQKQEKIRSRSSRDWSYENVIPGFLRQWT